MEGETILAIVTAVASAVVTIITILVRAQVIGLKKEIVALKQTLSSTHAIVMRQNELITSLNAQLTKERDQNDAPKFGDN